MDENAVGTSAELIFAPIDASFADDAPLLPSGFRIISLESGKTFIAQEQICLKRLWLSNNSTWMVAYRPVEKKNRVYIKLTETLKLEHIKGVEKALRVYFLAEMPIWILFFALGVSSDKEVVNLIDVDTEDTNIVNILVASIHNADNNCEDFRKGKNALAYVDTLIKGCKFPPQESVEECIKIYLFPNLSGLKQKARFLGYMVKCLLHSFIGRRKVDNRDDFRNKRLELAGELLERELRAHIKHAERRMVKAMQRDLYGDRQVQPIEQYLDASIITNGLSRAFSTGHWCHPYKKMERVSGVVATLRRTNPLQMTADMRKMRQQVKYSGKVGDARYPHPSHWGKVCFLSTSDGENCGLVKNLASMGLVSTTTVKPLLGTLFQCGMQQLVDDSATSLHGKQKVLLNGDWVGVCEDSALFVSKLRRKRRRNEVPHQRVALALSPSHLGSHGGLRLPLGTPKAHTFARWICQSYRCFLGVELLKSIAEGSESILKRLWHHSDAIICCSAKAMPVFTFANQAGLDMLETTLVALQDITLEKNFDDHGKKNLCTEFP